MCVSSSAWAAPSSDQSVQYIKTSYYTQSAKHDAVQLYRRSTYTQPIFPSGIPSIGANAHGDRQTPA